MNDDVIYDLLVKKLIDNIPMMSNYNVTKKIKTISEKGTVQYTSYAINLLSSQFCRSVSFRLVDYYTEEVIRMNVYNLTDKDQYPFHHSFSVDDYLNNHLSIKDYMKFMQLSSDPNKLLSWRLQCFWDKLLPILDKEFFEILEGKKWISVSGIDWREYVGM